MAKQKDKELLAYQNGLAKALEIVKGEGVEGLEKEIEFRRITFTPAYISTQKYLEWEKETTGYICESVCVLLFNCLIDEFGFGAKRLAKLIKRFNSYAENIEKEYVDWAGIIDCVENEGKINIQAIKDVFHRPVSELKEEQCYDHVKRA